MYYFIENCEPVNLSNFFFKIICSRPSLPMDYGYAWINQDLIVSNWVGPGGKDKTITIVFSKGTVKLQQTFNSGNALLENVTSTESKGFHVKFSKCCILL